MSRGISPKLPSKDNQSRHTTTTPTTTSTRPSSIFDAHQSSSRSRYVNDDLAEAVRDSVQIGPGRQEARHKASHERLAPPLSTTVTHPAHGRTSPLAMQTSFQPSHGYSQSSPDMASIAQPALPSQRMQAINQNPFEEDEIEPAGTGRIKPPKVQAVEAHGQITPTRAKFARTATG
jgi:hypothetical protein